MADLIKQFLRSYSPGVIFGMLVFVMSVMPVDGEGASLIFSFPGADKVVHGVIYSILTILLLKDYLRNIPLHMEKTVMLLFSILVYSIIIEIVQSSLTTYRSGELLDVAANMGGIMLGAAMVLFYRKIRY